MILESLSMYNWVSPYFSAIMTVFTMLSGMVTYKLAKNILMERTINQISETVLQMSDAYDSHMKGMRNSLAQVCNLEVSQEELCNGVVNRSDGYTSYGSSMRIIERMIVRAYYNYSVSKVAAYGNEGDVLLVPFRETGIDMTPLEPHETTRQEKGRSAIASDSGREDSFLMVKRVEGSPTMGGLGAAVMRLRKDYLKSLINNTDLSSKDTVMLLDEKKESLFDDGRSGGTDKLTGKMAGLDGYFSCETNGGQYVAVYHQPGNTNWTIIGLIPMVMLVEQPTLLKVQAFLLAIALLLVSPAVAKALADRMIRLVGDMFRALVKFTEGDFSARAAEYSKDETGKLGHVFSETICQVEGLINTVVENKSPEKELEFQALQVQINPHFPYSTMDIINWMTYEHKETEICDMVQLVSCPIRLNISHKAGNLTLEQEISYIRDYLYIQRVHYGGHLEVLYQTHEEINRQTIPRLTIQSLVENPTVHGLERSDGKCLVLTSTHRHGETVEILVKDTGGGIDDERMRELRDPQEIKTSSSSPHTYIGFYAVDQRIKYLPGAQYGLTI